MRPGRRMDVDVGGHKRTDQPMMQHHIANGEQKWEPLLVKRDDNHDHKEMEMHLDIAAGEMHQNYGGGHETAAGHGGAEPSTACVPASQESGHGDHAYLKKTMCQFTPTPCLGTCNTDDMEPEQDDNTPVSRFPYG